MVPQAARFTSWDELDNRLSPSGTRTPSFLGEERALLGRDGDAGEIADGDDWGADLEGFLAGRAAEGGNSRRSPVTSVFAAVADFGGPNSFRSFSRSWQRAAAFPEVIPRRPSLILSSHEPQDQHQHDTGVGSEDLQYGRSIVSSSGPQFGLLRQHLEASASEGPFAGPSTGNPLRRPSLDAGSEWESKDVETACEHLPPLARTATPSSIFAAPPCLANPSIIGSYGSHYGTMSPCSLRARSRGIQSTGQILRDAGEEEDTAHGEEQPILVKGVRQNNKFVLTVEGQSTLPQSIFNTMNAIIGVGLLSLPLAFKMSGWIIGLSMLTITAAVTGHTANLLAKCMDFDASLITYSDLAFISFGTRARVVVSALFTLELVCACVAMLILFADSLASLLPSVATATTWKCVSALSVLLLNTMPLRWLSYTSIVGICSTFCIICIITIDGFIKPDTPGSLWQPAVTHLLPTNWLSLPFAYGLMLSPWGAHSVFPSIYRDMRHPYKWGRAVKVTFSFSYVLDTCLAIIGLLMFGDGIGESITNSIIKTTEYPKSLTILICTCVAVIPTTKLPLHVRPLVTTADVLCGLHPEPPSQPGGGGPSSAKTHPTLRSGLRALVRVSIVSALLAISIVFPAFDSVCAFLGAALCSLISVVLPLLFHLKLYWREISVRERVLSILLLTTFSLLGLMGTVWTFLPKSLVGA